MGESIMQPTMCRPMRIDISYFGFIFLVLFTICEGATSSSTTVTHAKKKKNDTGEIIREFKTNSEVSVQGEKKIIF